MTKFLLISDTHFGFSSYTSRIWSKYWKKQVESSPEFLELDCLILAGDLASHELRHLKTAFKFFRSRMGEKKIVWVRGNHDYWDSRTRDLDFLILKGEELAKEFDIHSLHGQPMVFLEPEKASSVAVVLAGWDTWYMQSPERWTQDLNRIPGTVAFETHAALSSRALSSMLSWVDSVETWKTSGSQSKLVTITHMPGGFSPDGRHIGQPESWWKEALLQSDVLCYGHTHRRHEEVVETDHGPCLVLNAGCDYDKPNHLFFEV